MNAKQILAQSKAATASILATAKGHSESIYKASAFEGLEKSEKSRTRNNLRKYIRALLQKIAEASKKESETLCQEFLKVYQECYKSNDFTLASIASGNAQDEHPEVLEKGLKIASDYFTKSTRKSHETKH